MLINLNLNLNLKTYTGTGDPVHTTRPSNRNLVHGIGSAHYAVMVRAYIIRVGITTDRVSTAGNAIASVRLSSCPSVRPSVYPFVSIFGTD